MICSNARLWLGTDGDGLRRYDPAQDTFESFNDAFKGVPVGPGADPMWRIGAIARPGGTSHWVASNHGAITPSTEPPHANAPNLTPHNGNSPA